MTLAATSPTITYIGDGSADTFPFPYPVFSKGDITVSVLNTNVTPNVSIPLTIGTDYNVTGLNAAGTPPSTAGIVTLVNNSQAWLSAGKLATGYSLVLERIVAVAQLTSVRNQGTYYPETIEDALDYLTMICQQLTSIAAAGGGSGGGSSGTVIIPDLLNGHTYQVVAENGVIGLIEVS